MAKKRSEWVQLKRGNDWGYEYLAPKPLSDFGTASGGLLFKVKQRIEVKWPDDTVTTESVSFKSGYNNVDDMGHSSTVYFKIPGIKVKTEHGVTVWIPLDTKGLKVRPDCTQTHKDARNRGER